MDLLRRHRTATHDDERAHPAVGDPRLPVSRDGRHDDGETRIVERTAAPDRKTVLARERRVHGGVKPGAAFFGFLCAVGVGVLLTALLAAAGTAFGLAQGVDAQAAAAEVGTSVQTVGLIGAAVLLGVLFLAYYCGGYVAGRMARFDGAKQGAAVWLWAIVVAVLVAAMGAVGGAQYNILAELNSFPRIPVNEGDVATVGLVTAGLTLVVTLVGAVLGGLAGMRFHRKVDRTGLGG